MAPWPVTEICELLLPRVCNMIRKLRKKYLLARKASLVTRYGIINQCFHAYLPINKQMWRMDNIFINGL
jgi:hypothetical protein